MKIYKNNLGFTLIELTVAVLILAILSSMIINMVSQSQAKSQADLTKVKTFDLTVKNKLIDNLIGEWTFDDGSSSILYNSSNYGSDLNGTISGATSQSSANCVSGACLSFNSTSSNYAEVSDNDNLDIAGDLTIESWVKFNSITQTNQTIVAKNSSSNVGYWLFYNWSSGTSQKFIFSGVNNTFAYSSASPIVSTWTHVAVIRSGTDVIFYINGAYDNKTAVGGSVNSSSCSYPLRFSSRSDGTANYFLNGLLDEVRVYSAALTTVQIQEQYFAGLNKLLANGGITKQEYNQRVAALQTETAQK